MEGQRQCRWYLYLASSCQTPQSCLSLTPLGFLPKQASCRRQAPQPQTSIHPSTHRPARSGRKHLGSGCTFIPPGTHGTARARPQVSERRGRAPQEKGCSQGRRGAEGCRGGGAQSLELTGRRLFLGTFPFGLDTPCRALHRPSGPLASSPGRPAGEGEPPGGGTGH